MAPNQIYFEINNTLVFQSYETIVCSVTNYENGNHPVISNTPGQPQSKTTAKYLNRFLHENHLIPSTHNYKNI
jgi:hypothetical protein